MRIPPRSHRRRSRGLLPNSGWRAIARTMTGIHTRARRGYSGGMAAPDSITPNPRRFSIRLPRPLWIGLATAALVVIAGILRVVIPAYRQQVAIREIRRNRGEVPTERAGPEWLRDSLGDERMKVF